MRKNKKGLFLGIAVLAAAGVFFVTRTKDVKAPDEALQEIAPALGSIETTISCTGTVLPKNRLEIKPPVSGRIEQILVKEGEKVKTGQVLAWMSSTDRAALLDAARGKGEKALAYWQDTYKPIPLPAPMDGDVIVATTQPGQTVTTGDAVVVLSDQLIVRAQVDETDIGKVKMGQEARLHLDAYPDEEIKAAVEHIYYESQTVNNVTIYNVDLVPESVPAFFRSGMNASIDFVVEKKTDILLLPASAVAKDERGDYVMVRELRGNGPVKRAVTLGLTDDKNVEIVSGLTPDDKVIAAGKKYVMPQKERTGTNPFMPARH